MFSFFYYSVLYFLTFCLLKSFNLYIARTIPGLPNVFALKWQPFFLTNMDMEFDISLPRLEEVDSSTYYRHFIKKNFLKKQLESHFNAFSVFVAKMATASTRAKMDEDMLEQALLELSLNEFVLGVLDFDDSFIMGYQFINLQAKNKFQEHIQNDCENNYVIINPAQTMKVDFHLKPFPFGLHETNLQTQLGNYGTVVNFKYATKLLAGRQILKNELYFSLNLKEGIERHQVPAYIKHNGAFFALSTRLLPPICSLCRKRGHGRDVCDHVWCIHCNSKQFRIHECVADLASDSIPVVSPVHSVIPEQLSLVIQNDATPFIDTVPEALVFSAADDIPSAQPSTAGKKKSRGQRKKVPPVIPLSQSDTDDLNDEQIMAPMDTSGGTGKRKLSDIHNTTSEEDQGDLFDRNINHGKLFSD